MASWFQLCSGAQAWCHLPCQADLQRKVDALEASLLAYDTRLQEMQWQIEELTRQVSDLRVASAHASDECRREVGDADKETTKTAPAKVKKEQKKETTKIAPAKAKKEPKKEATKIAPAKAKKEPKKESKATMKNNAQAKTKKGAKKPTREQGSESGFNDGPLRLAWASAELQGWRKSMEDSRIVLPQATTCSNLNGVAWEQVAIFGVLDGHGGAQVARFCSKRLPEELVKFPISDGPHQGTELAEALRGAFSRIQQMLEGGQHVDELEQLANPPSPNSARFAKLLPLGDSQAVPGGSTACICCITETQIITANLGDSRAVLCRGGRAIPLTKDQKPENAAEKQRIEAAGGWVTWRSGQWRVNGDLNLSRALGDLEYKGLISAIPDITIHDRSPEDEFLVLGSDGIFNVKTDQEVVDAFRRSEQLLEDAETLLKNCVPGGDNVSVSVVCLN
ncbi:unnamed protein product [Symbiodinium natans]|uniref:PPM-type phosphatase domain-containing protein n=1 Tax=Symbiodinium natans TaxID=878477 RepID=A0A812T6I5_9DINO|nr:unnamed protein product [Symbiodinium natans]